MSAADVARENRELHQLRAQVAAVRELHRPDETWDPDWYGSRRPCRGCTNEVSHTWWPCPTAKALGEAS